VIAHEINNPLEAIGNLVYLLAGNIPSDTESSGYVQQIESELLRISAITKQTLRWSREDIEGPEFATAGAVFEDVLRLYAGKIRNHNVQVVTEGKEVRFFGQVGQITQVIANLVSNAIQALPVDGKFSLSAFDEGNTMSMIVRDEGHGMDAETLQSVFKPFFTTKGDLGNGLGLYISKEIVERHGGKLVVNSELGLGTTIQIWLSTRPS
jgi:signal transduction histidine kinase